MPVPGRGSGLVEVRVAMLGRVEVRVAMLGREEERVAMRPLLFHMQILVVFALGKFYDHQHMDRIDLPAVCESALQI
jgi:hypothetical protein